MSSQDALQPRRASALDLPFELTSKIFVLCLPIRGRVRPHGKLAPLLLAQICTQWRAVALKTPQLWRSIHLEFSQTYVSDSIPLLFGSPGAVAAEDQSPALLDLWFTRAGVHALSVSLICSEFDSYPRGLLPAISAHFERWGRLELAMPMADFIEFNEIKGPFPLLRSLSIQITDSPEPFLNIAVNTMLNSPRLVALHLLDRYNRKAVPNSLAAIPRTITTLQVGQPWNSNGSFDSYLKLFAHLPHLIHLGSSSASFPTGNAGPSSLTPHLRSLILDATEELEFLSLPTLEHLQVELLEVERPGDVRRLIRFLVYCVAPRSLTSLTLELAHLRDVDLWACFSVVPGLVTLQLVFVAGGERASFAAHCDKLQHPMLLPSLRNLILTDAASRPPYGPFVTLLQRRRTLEHAELHISPRHADVRRATEPPGAEILSELAALVATGLTVRVMTPNFAWPVDALYCDPVGDLDRDVFGSRKLRPYHFAPF
ncbi:hypothetical protein C8F04DRAFT_1395774 [Mycena alexandri]|uniref:F-box domain-containing protein n=1 Tax=Mycena alexandri TaxID=1745969 RepID=A0AAD6SWD3_9AGAR|nr:hypothetical protein C8F04DRAFT_1395774 [Mycena alexandri]